MTISQFYGWIKIASITAIRLQFCALALWVTGCGSSKESLYELDHETPAHWPSDLNDAVSKISDRLAVEESDPNYSAAHKELADLATWAAELTADTDMPEEEWIPVYGLGETLRQHLTSSELSIDDCREDFERLQSLLMEVAEKYAQKPILSGLPEDSSDVSSIEDEGGTPDDLELVDDGNTVDPTKETTLEAAPMESSPVEKR